MIKKISILGSTGSIGISTIDIVKRHPDRFQVVGLAAGSNLDVLIPQIKLLKPKVVSVKSEKEAAQLKQMLGSIKVDILHGPDGACVVASLSDANMVISAIVGASGLLPTLKALEKGKDVGLANKESMIIAGELMYSASRQSKATILPVDSEHSAIFQCLQGQKKENVKRLTLTASGGPFLKRENLKDVTVKEALKHPNWDMGAKITIDSATMMNKGLEVMEARWLFDMPVEKVNVCIHPQSIIHSMVDFIDGSSLAQLGLPDMKVPIAYALSYPERIETGVNTLDLWEQKELTFFKPDLKKFGCLRLAFEVATKGGSYPAVLNAANEIAVEAFLKEKIAFTQIEACVENTLNSHQFFPIKNLEDVLQADTWARDEAKKFI